MPELLDDEKTVVSTGSRPASAAAISGMAMDDRITRAVALMPWMKIGARTHKSGIVSAAR